MNTPRQAAFAPKLWTVLRNGPEVGSGITRLETATAWWGLVPLGRCATCASVSLLRIASGTTPDKGLVTTVVAGLLISALGGTRFQIGGPTGAFIPVVYVVIAAHGFDGLVLATLMAGILLVVAGLLKVGALMRFMPQPLVTGFTSGIAVIIAASSPLWRSANSLNLNSTRARRSAGVADQAGNAAAAAFTATSTWAGEASATRRATAPVAGL